MSSFTDHPARRLPSTVDPPRPSPAAVLLSLARRLAGRGDLLFAAGPGPPFGQEGPAFDVIANSSQAAHEASGDPAPYVEPHPVGERIPVQIRDGAAFVSLRGVPPSEVIVLINRP